ncbi:MAG: alkaline phosphatase family protein [Polyangiales bacterium]
MVSRIALAKSTPTGHPSAAMLRHARARASIAFVCFAASPLVACSTTSTSAAAPTDASPDVDLDAGSDVVLGVDGDPYEFIPPPTSCAFTCPLTHCAEVDAGYTCPSMAPWATLPHDTPCGAFDGTMPTPTAGKCVATIASGEAAKYAGNDPDAPTVRILPDGRRLRLAGAFWLFDEAALPDGLPSAMIAIPGTPYVVSVDNGDGPHSVRAIDTSKIASGANPVTSFVAFLQPETLNSGLAFVAPDKIFVATSDGVVQAIDFDATTGTLTRDDAASLKLPGAVDGSGKPIPFHLSAVAASPDGTRLVAVPVLETHALVFDVTHGGAHYGEQLGEIDLGGSETFAVAFDPHDSTGHFAYVAMWGSREVLELDLSNAASLKVSRSFKTDKNPQGLAFLDARWLAVSNAYGDTLTLVDRSTGNVTPIPVDAADPLHGEEPSSLAWDPTGKRLYSTLAGINAVAAWDVDVTAAPPTMTPAGRIPTAWWPSALGFDPTGALMVLSMRGLGRGAQDQKYLIGTDTTGDVESKVEGGIQRVSALGPSDLTAGDATVTANNNVGAMSGAPTVSCPAGSPNDFPIPTSNGSGASKQIQHVIFVVRENKSFDGVMGDMPGVNGDPTLTLGATTAQMDQLWGNLRALAKTFTHSDNYYTDAELSQQGHFWTAYGRSSDYNERTWAVDGYNRDIRNAPFPTGGVSTTGVNEEGSMFQWLYVNKVSNWIWGEALGQPTIAASDPSPLDIHYPGGFIQSIGYPDIEKACYAASHARMLCDFPGVVYMTLPNDHTNGTGTGHATPMVMIAENDEATGMLVDAISHSPMWPSTLIVITEDDPAQGGEHVDNHRTPLVLASPWVKRGYVSKTHADVSSIHRLIANIFGIPYPNAIVEHAAVPFDIFTSTPDYTPYTYLPRTVPLSCGALTTAAETRLQRSWDLREVDEQPGLTGQVERSLRGVALDKLPRAMEEQIYLRALDKALEREHEDEDDER